VKKIQKAKGVAANETEVAIARALLELEAKDMSAELADLFIVAAKEVAVAGKKAVVVFVPFRQHNKWKKIQGKLIGELEKKLGKNVVILAQRTILAKTYKRSHPGQMRPRSRTLTAVHQAMLEDVVYPTQIVGKRLRVTQDLKRILKVHLDPAAAKSQDYKLKTFQAVYSALTNKNVEFSFPTDDA